ncbi:MAG: hypothetical protein GY953_44400 [bacterium]|nr:hypothetical protein [bacterium]
MSGSTNKTVIVQRFDREPLRGHVNPQTWLQADGLELLRTDGNVAQVPYADVKVVVFVRDLDGAVPVRERRIFTTRPKTEGLWIRMLFRDGDYLDGLLPNNLLSLVPQGFTLMPPEPTANNQRIFVPKAALTDLKVLGVIGGPLRRRKRTPPSEDQIKLFE